MRSLFAGRHEAAEVPPKRGPGRPPKVRKENVEEERDVVAEALQDNPGHREAYDERLRVRHRKRKWISQGAAAALVEAAGRRRWAT